MATDSTGKSKSGGHINKSTREKSKNVLISVPKKSFSNTVSGKTITSNPSDKKSSALNFSTNISASSSEKYKTSNIGIKTSTPYSGKSNTNIFGDKAGSSESNNIKNNFLQQTTDKNYVSPSITSSKNKKSSMTFGIIWLPTKKRNKPKNAVYNPYDNDKRDRYKERSPSMYNFTSGDTSNHQVFIKKEEESHLLAPDQLKMPVGAAAIISDSLPVEIAYIDSCSEQEDIKRNNDDMKEAAGDSYDKKVDNDYLVNNESSINKTPDTSAEKKEDGDKVNGAFINMPTPPDKAWKSNTSTAEEDCNITCLYYTLQCCDCVIS